MFAPHGNTMQWHREALHCLRDKVLGRPLPSSLDEGIHVDDLFNYRPEDLPGGVPDKGEKRLYFTRPIGVNGVRKRSSEFGRWDARDRKQEISDLEARPLGFVQSLIYRQGRFPGKRTKWAMKEYTLASSRIPPWETEWVLCIIHQTKDYKRNGSTSGDVGPSNNPSSEPVLQEENQVAELTDLPLPNWLAAAATEFPMDPIMDLVNDPWYPREPPMDWVHEYDQWFEDYIWS